MSIQKPQKHNFAQTYYSQENSPIKRQNSRGRKLYSTQYGSFNNLNFNQNSQNVSQFNLSFRNYNDLQGLDKTYDHSIYEQMNQTKLQANLDLKTIDQLEVKKFGPLDFNPQKELEEFNNNFMVKQIIQHKDLQPDKSHLITLKAEKFEYFKILTQDYTFPLKIRFPKVKNPFKMQISFNNSSLGQYPKPGDLSFIVKKDCLYSFDKPKYYEENQNPAQVYITLFSKEKSELELKIWFTNNRLDKYNRRANQVLVKKAVLQELKEQKQTQDEQFKDIDNLKNQVQSIYEKRKKQRQNRMGSQERDIINFNKTTIPQYNYFQKEQRQLIAERNLLHSQQAQQKKNILDDQRRDEIILKLVKDELKKNQRKFECQNKKISLEKNKIYLHWLQVISLNNLIEAIKHKLVFTKMTRRFFKGNRLVAHNLASKYRKLLSDQAPTIKQRVLVQVKQGLCQIANQLSLSQSIQRRKAEILQMSLEDGKGMVFMLKLQQKCKIYHQNCQKIQIWYREIYQNNYKKAYKLIDDLSHSLREDQQKYQKYQQLYGDLTIKLAYFMRHQKREVSISFLSAYNQQYQQRFQQYLKNQILRQEYQKNEKKLEEEIELMTQKQFYKGNKKGFKDPGIRSSIPNSRQSLSPLKQSSPLKKIKINPNRMNHDMRQAKKKMEDLLKLIDQRMCQPRYKIENADSLARDLMYAYLNQLDK